MISAARSAWYAHEWARVRWERFNSLQNWHSGAPLVSVLLPTHNRAELLCTRALPSVLAQTYRNLEIIVAAHGCTDRTIARAFAFGDKRIRLLDVPRTRIYPPTAVNHWLAGPVVPLNAALKVARGAWLARIDDDDEWTADHVEKLLRFAQGGNFEFVSSAYHRYAHRDADVEVIGAEDGIGGTQTWLWRSYLKFMRYNPDCWRKRWHAVNDMDLAQRMRNAGVRIGYLDEVTALIKPRPGEDNIGFKAYTADTAATERRFAF